MRQFIGQGLLVLYSFIFLMRVPADMEFVAAFLVTLIYICVGNTIVAKRILTITTGLYLLAGVCFPDFLLFAPAVLYEMLKKGWEKAGIVLGIFCAYFYVGRDVEIFVLLICGCGFACVLFCQSRQCEKLAEEYRKIRDDSMELNLKLKEKNQNLLKNQDYEIYTATLKERNRIAREIHDNVGHMLSRAILMVGAMKAVNREGNLEEPLEQLEGTLHTAMTSVRESVHDLHDDSVNLKEVLLSLTEANTFCPVSLSYDMGYVIPREVKYSFIAIVKEALSNIAKHSKADRVDIVVREHPGLYQLIIEDNGCGAKETDGEEKTGIGIRNMQDRVAALGGRIQITAEKGFSIYITVPKEGGRLDESRDC